MHSRSGARKNAKLRAETAKLTSSNRKVKRRVAKLAPEIANSRTNPRNWLQNSEIYSALHREVLRLNGFDFAIHILSFAIPPLHEIANRKLSKPRSAISVLGVPQQIAGASKDREGSRTVDSHPKTLVAKTVVLYPLLFLASI